MHTATLPDGYAYTLEIHEDHEPWDGDAEDMPDPDRYHCVFAKVEVFHVKGNKLCKGRAYLGGTYIEHGMNPIPAWMAEAGDYLQGLVDEALHECQLEGAKP